MKPQLVLIGEDETALKPLAEIARAADFIVEDALHSPVNAFVVLRSKKAPLAVIDLGRDADGRLRWAQDLKLKLPELHIAVSSSAGDPDSIVRAMRAGAEEFFIRPFDPAEARRALDGLRERIASRPESRADQGAIVAVFPAKGGAGGTTVATNLAVALAQSRRSVCIVDLALRSGAVATFLNVEPSCTMAEFVRHLPQIDRLFLEGSLVIHPSGARILAEPFESDGAAELPERAVDQVLSALAGAFDYVVVDAPHELDDGALAALDRAHVALLVLEPSVPALKSALRSLERLRRRGVAQGKIKLVMNRHAKTTLRPDAVEKALGLRVSWRLPADFARALEALNQGRPVVESDARSDLARGHRELAAGVAAALGRPLRPQALKTRLLQRWQPLSIAGWQEH